MAVRRYYICDNEACNHTFDVSQAYDDPTLKKCPKCKKNKLYQDLAGMYVAVTHDATTVGQLAERNTKKMGQYELQEKRNADGVTENTEKRAKREKLKKLSTMTEAQKTKYIYEGD